MAAISIVGIPKAALSTVRPMVISTAIWTICAAALFAVSMPAESRAGFLYVPPGEHVAVGGSGKDRAPALHDGAASGADDRGRRVPGRSPVFRGAPDSAERTRLRRADAEPPENNGAAGPWQVRPGEMLRDILGRWGRRAGVEVLFLTDRRYRLHEGRTFEGPFENAVEALFAALSHLPHPPAGETRAGGRTLAVMHKSDPTRTAGGGR